MKLILPLTVVGPDLTLPISSISSPQTAHDVLHELCGMLGLQGEEDVEEFGLCADLGKGGRKYSVT